MDIIKVVVDCYLQLKAIWIDIYIYIYCEHRWGIKKESTTVCNEIIILNYQLSSQTLLVMYKKIVPSRFISFF